MKKLYLFVIASFCFSPFSKAQEIETDLNKLFELIKIDSATHYEINYSIDPEKSKIISMPGTAVTDFINTSGITLKHTELVDQTTYFTKSESLTIYTSKASEAKTVIEFIKGALGYKCIFDKNTKLEICNELKTNSVAVGQNSMWGIIAYEYLFFHNEIQETAQLIPESPIYNSFFDLFFCKLMPRSFPIAFTVTVNSNQLYFKLTKVKLNQNVDFIQPVNYNDIKAVETPINQLLVHFIENK